jgi:hypothetical protein
MQGIGTADQFLKFYNDLPRRIGELSQREAKEYRYKRELVTKANIIAPQIINMINNGGSLYCFDTSTIVMKQIEELKAVRMAGNIN